MSRKIKFNSYFFHIVYSILLFRCDFYNFTYNYFARMTEMDISRDASLQSYVPSSSTVIEIS